MSKEKQMTEEELKKVSGGVEIELRRTASDFAMPTTSTPSGGGSSSGGGPGTPGLAENPPE